MNLRQRNDNRTIEEKRQQFLSSLEETGNVTASAKKVKISRSIVYDWLADDPEFKKGFEKAAEKGVDALEDEAVRRAVQGVKKPVFQGGKKVGTINEFSDTLLIFLLKGKKPAKYKERFEHSGDAENPIKHEVKTIVEFRDMTDFKV